MKNSLYCYIHSFGKLKHIPWYKNSTIHLIVTLLGIILTVALYNLGPSKENQEKILNNGKKTHEKISNIEVLIKDKINKDKQKKEHLVSDLINKSYFDILTEVVGLDFQDSIKTHFDMKIKEVATGNILKDVRFVDIQNNFENYRHVAIIVNVIESEFFNFDIMIESGLKKSSDVLIIAGMKGKPEKFDSRDLVFTNNLYIYYTEAKIDLEYLREQCKSKGINLILRDQAYWSKKIINKDL